MSHVPPLLPSQPHRLLLPLKDPEEVHFPPPCSSGSLRLCQHSHRGAGLRLQLLQTRTRQSGAANTSHARSNNRTVVLLQTVTLHNHHDEYSETCLYYIPQIYHQTQAHLHGLTCVVHQHGILFRHVHG